MRGGYHNGGRPKGSKNSGPRKGSKAYEALHGKPARKKKEDAAPSPTDQDATRQMLEIGRKAKRKIYQEFLQRVANRDKDGNPLNLPPLTTAEKRLMDKIGVELEAEPKPEAPKPDGAKTDLEAGEYLRQVWNDPGVETALRIRAAEIMCKGADKGKGKKDEKADRAKSAGTGKYASMSERLRVVK
jgi:hypothetical protein